MNQIPNIEEIANKYLDNYDGDYCGDCYDCNKKKKGLIATIHQELQKAREEERERIIYITKNIKDAFMSPLTERRWLQCIQFTDQPKPEDQSELDQGPDAFERQGL